MTPFHTIAVPHRDILEGRFTMNVFMADLWRVFRGTAPDEYKDPTRFFQKTYQTDGIKNLLSIVEGRLKGQGGDPVIQIQTPFGGGKTHALIAMYHKASERNAQKVVLVGTPMRASDTLWGLLEKQLTGKVGRFDGLTAPGRDLLDELLSENQPVLILMDEVLEYMTKAAGVPVGDSTLASQTLAFMQELTEVAGILEQVALVITLPSGTMEHYGEGAEQLFRQLGLVAGRVEKIYTPVQEHEIAQVIRQRLFSQIDMKSMNETIRDFMEYADGESILPPGTEPSEYRKRFEAAYPFQPEVIDVLYQRWGSFPSFQRTRGVLRLLSLVIDSLKEKAIPYISLADFDLSVQEIRQELLKHIGPEYESVISADITGKNAGAKKVDVDLGDAYKGLRLGSRAATTVFLYSFSGGIEKKGTDLREIKRSATTTGNPSSVLTEAIEGLQERLLYLQHDSGRARFTNRPNLNSILLTRMENINERAIDEFEETILKKNLSGRHLSTFVLPQGESDIPDNADLKLVLLKERDNLLMRGILETKGNTPRVNRNTLFFLTPLEHEAAGFFTQLRRIMAYEALSKDRTLNLSPEQQKEVRIELKKATDALNDRLRRYYRTVLVPTKEGLKESDLGMPTYGVSNKLDEVVYDKLRLDGDILERIDPLVIKERYLRIDYVSTEQLYQSSVKAPGEARVIGQGWESGIRAGVERGLFGLGELEDEKPICRYFKERPPAIAFSGSEVIIREDICTAQKEAIERTPEPIHHPPEPISSAGGGTGEEIADPPDPEPTPDGRASVHLKFTIPKGKVAGLMGVMNLLQLNFDNLQIELLATEGQMSDQDYEDKIKEAFVQLGIDPEE